MPNLDIEEKTPLQIMMEDQFKVLITGLAFQFKQNGRKIMPLIYLISSVRSEGQFNTMIYDESDVFRKQKSRNVLYISAVDIEKLGFQMDL